MATAQLLLYGFGPTASFEGQLVGALERIESGGTVRILDGIFIRRDADTDELSAIGLGSGGAGMTELLGFRLDAAERRRATERALSGRDAIPAETVQALGKALQPGAALAAVLIQHAWADVLEDAVTRADGTQLASTFVDATALAEVSAHLLDAAGRAGH
jgi:hypothetical protein